MPRVSRTRLASSCLFATVLTVVAPGQPAPQVDPAAGLLAPMGPEERSRAMVAGISRYLERATLAVSAQQRPGITRERLARKLGVIDARLPASGFEFVAAVGAPARIGETTHATVDRVRWPVLDGVYGEGLWLRPKGPVHARVVVLPDADQTPELIAGVTPGLPPEAQFARRLAEQGCEVIVPVLIDRSARWSNSPRIGRDTNQPHREWIYRQAFPLGRHVIGYELQTIFAAFDHLESGREPVGRPLGIIGWGEGGLLALHAAALDQRVTAALVSGYFAPREGLWREPIDRNVFGLLAEAGDAEIAQLVLPRALVIEHARHPEFSGPPAAQRGRAGAAPGRLATPPLRAVQAEVARTRDAAGDAAQRLRFHVRAEDLPPVGPAALADFLQALAVRVDIARDSAVVTSTAVNEESLAARQERKVREMERFTQRQLQLAAEARDAFFWRQVTPGQAGDWAAAMRPWRDRFARDVLGRLPASPAAPVVRSRVWREEKAWTAHDVVIDVHPDIFAWGYLLVPKTLQPGERRPVVVVQHGLEGLPGDVIEADAGTRAFRVYQAFGARLAERGFVVFAPHNPYRGEEEFRGLQRQANPLGLSLFSFIVAQHEALLGWLGSLAFVDRQRIGFYGLSYGGKTAMRVPAVLDGYAAVVCSGDFNEWIRKVVSTDWPNSYMFTREWEIPEFDLGRTFGYAEMAALIAPRPFMVERGHDDGVAMDEWVAFEYAKVNRLYARLGIPERTAIEYFPGPHTIHGVGTFAFLHHHLRWPEPSSP